MTGRRPDAPSFFYGWLPRLISVLLALTVLLLIMAFPGIFWRWDAVRLLPLLAVLWGLAAGFVHGMGLVPEHPLTRLLLGPGPAWLLLLGALLWLLIASGPLPQSPG
ncbi:cyd operon YbgE family protein [Thiohalorhabdus sp. Cl-TMA]|uniref:Cyd operon YbgE family protein n=1 Tax=Thiohalorhabdus methylotrophus TaxID=3242694 RepID=A0ABV4TRT3_9GAMM